MANNKTPKAIALIFASFFIFSILAGCIENPGVTASVKEIPKFKSYADLKGAFDKAGEGRAYGIGNVIFGIANAGMMTKSMDTGMARPSAGIAEDAVSQSAEYSRTNVQVEGVDEADVVKTDGKFIYNFSNKNLAITEAYPIDNAKLVSETALSGIYPSEMLLNGDKLVIFGNKQYSYSEGTTLRNNYRYGGYGGTSIIVYDISDRANLKKIKEIEFEGSYLTSRMIGKNVYFVINSWPQARMVYEYNEKGEKGNGSSSIIPMMYEDGKEKAIALPEEVGYVYPIPAQSFVTLAALNLDTLFMNKQTIAGDAQSVYASENNIYLASTVWLPPETPVVKDIKPVQDVERYVVGDNVEKTAIIKFGLNGESIGFLGQGSVEGHVLNQFSMDEYEGNLRIATTKGEVWQTSANSTNNVYVLGKEMNPVGKLEGLAPGEKIYSARFMGKKAYLVTFKKVDPLFVLDLSDATNPKVLGKLKIPGYSDYLHPIDETHIIGVGKDTVESGYGNFAWYQGMKLAIFDVSDVENPKEMHKIIIGDRGTDSYALQNHKAFLYDKQKNLLVLPIELHEIPESQKKPVEGEVISSLAYGEAVFQGAFVYKVTLENGFEEKGRITHISQEEELKRGYYFSEEYKVKRALYIGDVLYTISGRMIKANSLDSLEELKQFVFSGSGNIIPE